MEEYPEPMGSNNLPGFVKSNPLNNESYLDMCCEAYPMWEDILRDTHAKLEDLIPGYNIAQIKDKFGGLRYYIDMPQWRYDEDLDDDDEEAINHRNELSTEAHNITWDAEERAVNLNAL